MTDRDYLEEAVQHILDGSAICFLGAGFSTLATDAHGAQVPSTSQLIDELWGIAGIPAEPGASLTDIADFFESRGRTKELRKHLVDRLTICNASVEQQFILELPWRAIFTTNFDDIVERVISPGLMQVVSPARRPNFVRTDLRQLYYLHGRALDILESDVDPGLVISESNYIDLRIKDSELYAAFVNEVSAATQVFFLGYSVKDTEIAARIVAQGESLRRKAIVVTQDGQGEVSLSRLAKFGAVFPIGVTDFSSRVYQQASDAASKGIGQTPAFLRPRARPVPKNEVTKEDVDRLILTGTFDHDAFAGQLQGLDPSNLYAVGHSAKIAKVLSPVSRQVRRYLVSSDVGNGKSIFLSQLSVSAIDQGFDVYEIDTSLPEVYKDVDLILAKNAKCIFIIDDLIRYRKFAEYIGRRLHDNAIVVCSTRSIYGSLDFKSVGDLLSGVVSEIEIDKLNRDQIAEWDRLLERWGYWESRIEWTAGERLQFLQEACNSENRSIIVSIFRTSQVSEKISRIVSFFLEKNPKYTTEFIAILINSLCQNHVRWDQIVGWLHIDEDALKKALEKEPVFNLLTGRRDWYYFTSTQLADHIFRTYKFDPEIVVDVYSRIVRETAYSSSDVRSGGESRENLKELMKFRFLTRLFGDGSDGARSIESVYSKLSKVPRIRQNDQFWLQYAMSCMERGALDHAETYIKTGLGIAEKKGMDYEDDQIIDQRIRLYFMKNSQLNYNVQKDELEIALNDLTKSLLDKNQILIYPIRSAPFILNLLDAKIDDLGSDIRGRILTVLDLMREFLDDGRQLPKAQRGETKSLREAVRRARLVLQNS